MIKRTGTISEEIRENMRGGDGAVKMCNFITPEELNGKGRLFGTIKLESGCGIGYHVHENDSELFYILKGTAVYSDNGEETQLCAGDVAICPAGTGHSIKNSGNEPVELIALIVYA